MEITKDAFQRFIDVRDSGVTNMFARTLVCELAEITKEEYNEIIAHFDELSEKYGC